MSREHESHQNHHSMLKFAVRRVCVTTDLSAPSPMSSSARDASAAAAAVSAVAAAPVLPPTPTQDALRSLAHRCHAHLLFLYATPNCIADLSTLVRITEACYVRMHWLWHHVYVRIATEEWTAAHESACVARLQQLQDSSDETPSLHSGWQALATLDALCRDLHSLLHPRADGEQQQSAPSLESDMDYCLYYCQQWQFEESRQSKIRKYQAKEAAKQAALQAEAEKCCVAAESVSASAAAAPADNSAQDSDDDSCSAPKRRGEPIPPPAPMRCCHPGGTCHLSMPTALPEGFAPTPSAAAAASPTQPSPSPSPSPDFESAYGAPDPSAYFPPFLLQLQSVFLLRMFFCYVFNEELLIPIPSAATASTSGEDSSLSELTDPALRQVQSLYSSPAIPCPSITRLCLTFLSWPPELHASIHAFEENRQYCGYAHMLVGIRGRGVGENLTNSNAAPSASAPSASSPALWRVLDGRVWKRAVDRLKSNLSSCPGLISSEALQSDVNKMLATGSAGSMALPFPPRGGADPKTLFVLGDSHSLTLHSQWLFLLYARRQEIEWRQMRTFLVVGMKAWHVGQAVPATDAAAPRAFSPLHQSSMLLRYASLIPRGSSVLFVAGEIDCRSDEGIATAVAKGHHPDVRTGMERTVAAYIRGVSVLAREHGWARVMFHPVTPPFLRGNKARVAARGWKDLSKVHARAQLIADFNEELGKQIAAMDADMQAAAGAPSSTSNPAPPRFSWLNFFPDLCAGTGNGARPTVSKTVVANDAAARAARLLLHADYTLEGMHLNTKYLPCVEREMEKVCDEEPSDESKAPE